MASRQAPVQTLRSWVTLASLSALFFAITAASFTSLGVALPDMVKSQGWNWTKAGLGYTLLGIACGLASYAPTLLIRWVGVRVTLLLGGGVSAAGLFCFARAHGMEMYWLGAILLGVGFALVATIPGTFLLTRAFRKASTAFGIYFTVGGLGGVAGPWLYLAYQRTGHDWRPYWSALAWSVLALAALAALIIKVGKPPSTDAASDRGEGQVFQTAYDWRVRGALKTPQFWIITAAYTAYLLCETSVNGLSVAHLTQRGVAAGTAGAMLSLQALLNALARSAGGFLGERFEPRRLVILALGLVSVGIAALAAARGLGLMLVYVLGVGVGYGLSFLASTVLLLNYFGRRRYLELFSIMCLVSTLAAAGPWVGGYVRDRFGGFEAAFILFAGIAATVMAAVALMRPPKSPRDAERVITIA